jgi:transposase-like protein
MSARDITADRWRRIIQQQQRSGLPVAAFCRRARVPQSSFFAWRRKLRDEASFAEVKLSAEPVAEVSGVELHLPGRRRVVVQPGFDRPTLLDLLAVLEASPSGAAMEANT